MMSGRLAAVVEDWLFIVPLVRVLWDLRAWWWCSPGGDLLWVRGDTLFAKLLSKMKRVCSSDI